MEALVWLGLLGILVFVGTFSVVWAVWGKAFDLGKRVRQLQDEDAQTGFNWLDYARRAQWLFRQIGEIIPRKPEEMSRQERRLIQAGIRQKDGPSLLHGTQAGLALILLATLSITGHLQQNWLLYGALAVLVGAALPDVWLTERIRRRKQRIQHALPDMLDLQVVCVEAGLGLDQSMMRIGAQIQGPHPDLADELRLLNLEVNAGKTRAEAQRNLAGRTDVEDLRALVAVLIQTDRFGTSIADTLRVFSESLRTKRRQRAEEMAAKMGVKMIPPLFLFILPATFAVVVGPAVIGIARGLLPFLRSPV